LNIEERKLLSKRHDVVGTAFGPHCFVKLVKKVKDTDLYKSFDDPEKVRVNNINMGLHELKKMHLQ
jgi:hypothetical protein